MLNESGQGKALESFFKKGSMILARQWVQELELPGHNLLISAEEIVKMKIAKGIF